jgi:sporulation protein YlmC with PRC-barrel domain
MSEIDLGLGILDHQLVDCDGHHCGKVDDLELAGVRDGAPRVAAILTGACAWRGRGLLGRLAAAVARGRTVRIPWEEVKEVHADVELRRTAEELGVAREDRARRLVERIPGASL